MSTLAEIEAAAEALPPEQKQELMVFLAARLRGQGARMPEPALATALDVFGDLHGMLAGAAGSALASAVAGVKNGAKRRGALNELRNPWAS